MKKENPFSFKDKKDREDFFIAIPVLLFFGLLLFWFGWTGGSNAKELVAADVEVVANTDLDGDAIPNHLDLCPEEPGTQRNNGCPTDTDGDGINDLNDRCPDEYGSTDFFGCPKEKLKESLDEDLKTKDINTSVTETSKDISSTAAIQNNNAVEYNDQDGDGVLDPEDKCPRLAGSIENNGCPLDSDGDGVYDKDDKCPNEHGLFVNGGCPKKIADKDGDGIPDNVDDCPDLAGDVTNKGCPEKEEEATAVPTPEKEVEMSVADRKVIANAVSQVVFLPASANLTEYSKGLIKKLAALMKKYPDANLRISGHTDALGNDAENLQLSKDRARTCLNLLVDYGIARGRMSSEGFGETKPVAPNNTKAGRQKNRRVEFVLFE